MSSIRSALDYATFLGGTGMDVGMALALDATGRATITGSTLSSDFPITPGAYDTSYGGNWDVFIVRLNAAGSALDYATFLGGGANDGGNALALDAAGFAVVTGETESRDFPTTLGAFASGLNGYYGDTFVARLNPAGSALAYATFLGGSSHDSGSALALYEDGRIIVAGETVSRNFPTTPGAFDPNCGESLDAFVVRFDATGGSLDYATCLGGPSLDRASALALDATGRATVTGLTQSDSFPTTPGAFDSSYNGGDDVFIVRLNATGDALDYGTFLGGSSHDDSLAISVDANDRATVSGWTQSSDFPTTSSAFDTSHNGRHDAIVARLSADGSTLEYATFLGGSDDDRAFGLALDTFGRATVTGRAGASDFPITLGAVNPSFSGGYLDAFVTKLAMTTVVSSSYLPLIVHD